MKSFAHLALSAALLAATAGFAATPDSGKTLAYIHKAWPTLTRSLADCSALADSKVATHPLLYLPADFPAPDGLAAIAKKCGVEVRALPRKVARIGDIQPSELPRQGVLYLPNPYVVPGGFFNEMYGWDSYFIVLGLLADGHTDLARDMVENQLFEVEHYGAVLNANRSYYLTRSQPPFLSAMIRAVLDDSKSFHSKEEAQSWLKHAYPLAVRDHDIWTSKPHQAGDTGLARYFDYGDGPVPEFRDAKYLQDVIRWLRAHPKDDPGYLIKASQNPDDAEAAQLKKTSCDVRASTVCADAWLDGYRLTADYYRGDRAMRESGFDVTFRFGPFAGSTHHYAPACLNSLLFRYEQDLRDFAARLGLDDEAKRWDAAAKARHAAIDKYLWHADQGMYADYDAQAGKPSTYAYISAFYPLWAGAASKEQAAAMQKKIALLERKGGLSMSTTDSGVQWDEPFGWAPTNWIAIAGLDRYGYHDDARRLARKFTATIDRGFADDGTIREKYNMVSGDAKVAIKAGYKDNVIGFGWTNGVYLKLSALLAAPPDTP
ncbi:trehalase family glycosidase [Rudaea sp.]|uniref:trehalase family glycosidase n=1 Tax=Rudaea sp. TaxID=2136325 RepID=UPI00321FA5DF